MSSRDSKIPPALKHGAFSSTSVLPGESQAEFDNLHQGIVAEFCLSGALEHAIGLRLAQLFWRRQNLQTIALAEAVKKHRDALTGDNKIRFTLKFESPGRGPSLANKAMESPAGEEQKESPAEEEQKAKMAGKRQAALEKAQRDLGVFYELSQVGNAATADGLKKELELAERLDSGIVRCLKQLLMVRGVKSISATTQSAAPKQISAPMEAA